MTVRIKGEVNKHAYVPVPAGEKWYCTVDGPRGGACGKKAVIGCDGRGRDCLVGGDCWCKEHDPRNPPKVEDPPGTTPWRVGRTVGRTLYDKNDRLIGTVDTPDIASLVVEAVNGYWGKNVEPKVFPRARMKGTAH